MSDPVSTVTTDASKVVAATQSDLAKVEAFFTKEIAAAKAEYAKVIVDIKTDLLKSYNLEHVIVFCAGSAFFGAIIGYLLGK